MVAIIDFAAGYTIEKIVRAALEKINGFSLTVRVNDDYDYETVKDIFRMHNGVLLSEHRWIFLSIIKATRGYNSGTFMDSLQFQRHPLSTYPDAIPTHNFQEFPAKEGINVSPEDLIDLYPFYYINALSTKLAKELCIPLRGDINMKREMELSFRRDLAAARISDSDLVFRYGYCYE